VCFFSLPLHCVHVLVSFSSLGTRVRGTAIHNASLIFSSSSAPFPFLLSWTTPHTAVTLWASSMPYPPPEKASPDEIGNILGKLEVLLTDLPSQLPRGDDFDSKYGAFLAFALDEDILEKTGDEVATLGEQLEHAFGWRSRTTGDNIIPIVERGEAICALHSILVDFYARFPDNNVLKKWIIDVTLGAEKVFDTHRVPVCNLISQYCMFLNKLLDSWPELYDFRERNTHEETIFGRY
jgi:hypothetical protein